MPTPSGEIHSDDISSGVSGTKRNKKLSRLVFRNVFMKIADVPGLCIIRVTTGAEKAAGSPEVRQGKRKRAYGSWPDPTMTGTVSAPVLDDDCCQALVT